jgi:hypothetical protein
VNTELGKAPRCWSVLPEQYGVPASRCILDEGHECDHTNLDNVTWNDNYNITNKKRSGK